MDLEPLLYELHQRFDFTLNTPDQDLPHQIINLFNWLGQDARTRPYFVTLEDEFKKEYESVKQLAESLVKAFKDLMFFFLERHPEWDNTTQPTPRNLAKHDNPKHILDLLNGKKQPIHHLKRMPRVGDLLEALERFRGLYNRVHPELEDAQLVPDDPVLDRIPDLAEGIQLLNHMALRLERTHPYIGYLHLNSIYMDLMGVPPKIPSQEVNRLVQLQSEYRRREVIRAFVQGAKDPWIAELADVDKMRHSLRMLRLYFSEKVGTNYTLQHLFHTYKGRASWYDKLRLRELASYNDSENPRVEEQLTKKKKVEDRLVEDLALYLFDHGYPVLMKTNQQNLQPDLLHLARKHPFVVEGKVYKEADRPMIRQGVTQLYNYLVTHDLKNPAVREGYYVVYRLGGPLYAFPEQVPIGPYTIYPILVDLALAPESGSKAPKPVKPFTVAELTGAIGKLED